MALAVMYADLVELQLKALTKEDAQAWGCTIVPAFLQTQVKAELEKRK